MLALDGSQLNILIAFLAGFVTFFASCLLPLVPTYLAYLSGVSLQDESASSQRLKILKTSFFFVLGFTGVFVGLGLVIRSLYSQITLLREIMQKLGGVLFIILGLFMFGAFKSRFLSSEKRLDVHGFLSQYQSLHALLTGAAFGFGWSPCIGPVLALIFFQAAQSSTQWHGFLYLLSFGIGLGLPFILIALFFETLIPWLKKNQKISFYLTKAAAVFLVIAGILMLLGQFHTFSLWVSNLIGLNPLSI
jgi:cytochrome c-type biogenesis protein